MTPAERQTMIAKYKAGYDEVVRALAGIAADERDWRPAPGEWSAREVVHHLADSETISGIRLRRLLIEDNPAIQGYDEAEYARHFRYQERPWEPALRAFESARSTTAQLLDSMTEADWSRTGTHYGEWALLDSEVAPHLRGPRPRPRRTDPQEPRRLGCPEPLIAPGAALPTTGVGRAERPGAFGVPAGAPSAVIGQARPAPQAWLMWGIPAFLFLFAFFHRAAPGVFAKELMQSFGASGALIGLLSATYFYAYAGLMIPAGVLLDRLGVRWTVAVGGS